MTNEEFLHRRTVFGWLCFFCVAGNAMSKAIALAQRQQNQVGGFTLADFFTLAFLCGAIRCFSAACSYYMRAKGYSATFGWLGTLLLIQVFSRVPLPIAPLIAFVLWTIPRRVAVDKEKSAE